ncbi:hypothetical protein [Vibrio gigantis]|uniref:hypothetical protein n=1 Tax=Vibrio gigantis TaxID=296199 RepID=UPI0035A67E07
MDKIIEQSIKTANTLYGSGHLNPYNSKLSLFKYIKEICKITLSILRLFVFFRLNNSNSRSEFIFYIANLEKTKTEVLNIKKSNIGNRNLKFLTDKKNKDANLSARQLKANIDFRDFIILVKNRANINIAYRKTCLYQSKFDGVKSITHYLRFIYTILLIKSLKSSSILRETRIVVNFFTFSYFGSALNSACFLLGIPTFSYAWGSNIAGSERIYPHIDYLLLKSDADLFMFKGRSDIANLRKATIGNLAFSPIKKSDDIYFDVLIIDTCCTDLFTLSDKVDLYKKIIDTSKANGFENICIKLHPSSQKKDFNFLKEYHSVVIERSELRNLYTVSKLIVNINSTEVLFLKYAKFHTINLFPYFVEKYTNGGKMYSQFCETNLYDINSVDKLDFDWCAYLKSNVKEVTPETSVKTASENLFKVINDYID